MQNHLCIFKGILMCILSLLYVPFVSINFIYQIHIVSLSKEYIQEVFSVDLGTLLF